RRYLDLVEVVPGLVAIVDSDVQRIRINLGNGEELGSYALEVGQVSSGRHFLPAGILGGVDCIDVKILVAGLILGKQNIFAVRAPEIDANRACGVVGDGPGGAEWLGSPFDPDVASAFVRLDEGNKLPIGRDLAAGYFGIAKE